MANQDGSSAGVVDLDILIQISDDLVAQYGRPKQMETVEFLDNQNRYCSINGVQAHIDDLAGEINASNGCLLYEGGEYVFGVFDLHEVERITVIDGLQPEEKSGGFWSSIMSNLLSEKHTRKDNDDTTNSRFQADDKITKAYGFKIFTPKYEAIKKMVKKMQNVSSHSATSRRIDFYVHGSFPMKGVSIYLSYMTLESHLEPLAILQPWLKTAISLLLAVFVEFMFGYESGAIFNRTAQWMTRITGTVLAIAIFATAITFHLAYVVKETARAETANSNTVVANRNSSPEMSKLYEELDIIKQNIADEEKSIARKNQRINDSIASLKLQREVYLKKAQNYQSIVDNANSRGRSDKGCVKKGTKRIYGRVNGGCKPLATITSYANSQNRLASGVTDKIMALAPAESQKMESLRQKEKVQLGLISKEQERVIDDKNDVSSDSLSVIKVILIVVEIMSKMDLYGFFLARWNLRGDVIDYFEPVIDVSSTTSQMTGIIASLSHQNALVMKNQHDTLMVTNEAIEGINSSVIVGANMTANSHQRLLKEIIGEMRNGSRRRANYVPIGDEKHDVSNKRNKRTPAAVAEWERLLTEYVKTQGFDYEVLLTPNVNVGAIDGSIIKIEDSLLDEDLKKAVDHELTHVVTGSSKHDDEFKDKLKEVSKTEESTDKQPVTIRQKRLFFNYQRRLEILKMFYDKGTSFSQKEIEIFRKYNIWNEMKNCIDNRPRNHETFFESLDYEY